MRKRTRISEPFKEEFGWEDYVSALPDPILVSILSRLTLKEAVATSILSRRWRYLWTHVNDLKFDANDTLNNSVYDDKLMTSERSRYINWVNRVLRQHRGPVVDGVRICFNFHESSKRAVDNWVKFAIVKRVQRLELCLRVGLYNYTFPYKLLSRSKGMSLKNICSNYGLIQPGMPSRLEVLKLKSVNVSEEALDHIFSNCPVLNHLSIHNLGNLKNVKVSGLTLRLKYLEVVSCREVKSIEISNVNLVSFAYFGRHIKLIVCNVPMLGEISFGVQYYGYGLEKNVFEQLSCCLHQLEIVTLDIRYPEDNRMISAFPVLPNLKQLILKVGPWDDESLLALTSLIKACPNLNRFVLKYLYTSTLKRRKLSQGAKCMHEHLKSVEFIGYCGRTRDAEAVMYFIENVVALETIVIDPRNQIMQRSHVGIDQIENEVFARRHARKHLESKIPPGVQLIIL